MGLQALWVFWVAWIFAFPQSTHAYPIFAQQAYQSPREATGNLVCANCHLGRKSIEVSSPRSVFPDSVFSATVKVPYESSIGQLSASGDRSGLNIGAILALPEGFGLAPASRLSEVGK